MSLIKTVKKHNDRKPIIIVGKPGSKKIDKAITFVSDTPIISYANEYDIEDVWSIPEDRGIIIQEANFKPNKDLIMRTLSGYQGQVVLTSDNQKDVPKPIFDMCQLKRSRVLRDELKEKAPHAEEPVNYEIDIYSLVMDYLKNADRDDVATKLKLNKPPDVQFVSWLAPNLHPNKLSFADCIAKRRWSSDYFYELLAYNHDGRMFRKVNMPKRMSRNNLDKVCFKLGLKGKERYLLRDLMKDESFKDYMRNQLDGTETRMLKLGAKKRRKKLEVTYANNDLRRWI
jgi:hypothetical protein